MDYIQPNANDQAALLNHMEQLQGLFQQLGKALDATSDLPAWVLNLDDQDKVRVPGRVAAQKIYMQIEYEGNQDRNKSMLLPGIMAVDRVAMDLILKINAVKQAIKKFCGALEGQYVRKSDLLDPKQMPGDYVRLPYATYLFHKIGYARIHRVQLYRQITVLEQRPERLGFTWAHTRRVQSRSRDDVLSILDRLGDAGLGDRAKIVAVPDQQFAMVSDTQLNARANLVFYIDGETKRVQKTLSMPMVYLQEDNLSLPPCGKLSSDTQRNENRLPRLKDRIEDCPLTTEIPVYRYRQAVS